MKRKFPRPIPLLQKLISPPQPQPFQIPYPPPPPPKPHHHQNPQPLFPTLSLSHTPNHSNLLKFLESNLKPPLTPKALLAFLNAKLRHHPHFAQYDYHLFNWAPRADDTFRHDHSTVEWMARSLAATHRFSSLSDLLSSSGAAAQPCPCSDQGIFSCPRTEPIFGVAIAAYCRAGKLDEAILAFDAMTRLIDGKPGAALCNSLLNGFVKWDRFDEALGFYSRMVKGERVNPDVYSFNILLSGHCRNRRIESALELFREMKEKGINPNVVSFNTLIKGFFRERRFEEGVATAHEMVELGLGFSAVTCEILADGLCREGRVHEARDLLLDFARKRVVPESYDYFGVVEVLCPVEKGLEFTEEMWGLGNRPSSIACATLIEGLRKAGRFDRALGLAERMAKEGLVLDGLTFDCLMEDLCRAGRTAGADKMRRRLALSKGFEPSPTALNLLVSGYRREGKRKEGEKIVDEMLDKGFIPDIGSYNRLMDGLARSTAPSRPRGLGN